MNDGEEDAQRLSPNPSAPPRLPAWKQARLFAPAEVETRIATLERAGSEEKPKKGGSGGGPWSLQRLLRILSGSRSSKKQAATAATAAASKVKGAKKKGPSVKVGRRPSSGNLRSKKAAAAAKKANSSGCPPPGAKKASSQAQLETEAGEEKQQHGQLLATKTDNAAVREDDLGTKGEGKSGKKSRLDYCFAIFAATLDIIRIQLVPHISIEIAFLCEYKRTILHKNG